MPPLPRKSIKERGMFSLTTYLPCAAWWKVLLRHHLYTTWRVMMVLMVLFVAIQILGVFWQFRNNKLLNGKLLNMQLTIEIQRTLPTNVDDWGHLRSPPSVVVEDAGSTEREGGRRRGLDETVDTGPESKTMGPRKDNSDSVLSKEEDSRNNLDPETLLLQPQGVPVSQKNSKILIEPSQSHQHPQLNSAVLSPDSANELRSSKSPAASSVSKPRLYNTDSNIHDSTLDKNIAKTEIRTCWPKNHIFFLKTHKTASSTILNILYRYGDIRNLTFALPLNMHSQLFYPHYFEPYFVEGVRSRSKTEFHIMCNHMRFKISEVKKVMTKDTFYFSILRSPVDMMESLFMYYKSIPAFHKHYSLDDFLNNGWRSFNASTPNNHYARNVLAFDFGFDNNIAADDPDLEEKANMAIAAIKRDFQLILISEYFDESMILLKRALCWSLDDVISFKLNSRSQQSRRTLSPITAEKIRAWNALDWRLYLHFNATFWKKVDTTVGREEMKREVARLQERRAQLTETCLKDGGAVDPSQVKDAGLKPFQYGAAIIQGYNLNPDLDGQDKILCQNLITPELQYTKALYAKQFPELAAKHSQADKMADSQRQSRMTQLAIMSSPLRGREVRYRRTIPGRSKNPNVWDQIVASTVTGIDTVQRSTTKRYEVSKTVLLKGKVNRNNVGKNYPEYLFLQPEGVPVSRTKSKIEIAPSQSHQHPQLHATVQSPDSANELRGSDSSAPSTLPKPHLHHIDINIYNSTLDKNIAKTEIGTCRPKKHIFFLKTHKTASSTILNILYRYGDIRNLTFALPLNMHSQLFYPHYFEPYFVEGMRSRSKTEFHIMCNHMRFKMSEVRKVMAKDTFYFSILRSPVDMMESLFMYYKSIPAFHKHYSLDDFLNNGWRSFNVSTPNNHYARNVLAFDFGFDNNIAADDPDLEEKANMAIAAIERDFQLILISEYFDESMILLKRALCWSLDDVISFKLNSRSQQSRRTLSPITAEKIRAWNALDWRLYLHFNTTFWKRVDTTIGQEVMKREVARLQERRAQLTETCLKEGGAVDPSQVKDAGLKPFQYGAAIIQGYNLNPDLDGQDKILCQNLITPELQYTKALYAKQFPELAAKHSQADKMADSQRQSRTQTALTAGRVWDKEVHYKRTIQGRPRKPNTWDQHLHSSALSNHTALSSNRKMP